MEVRSEQELFWAGDFGNEYTKRNQSEQLLTSNLNFFSNVLRSMPDVCTVIEYGANRGINLTALKNLKPSLELSAVEINSEAIVELKKNAWISSYQGSIINFKPPKKYDCCFVKGVLIHINPQHLHNAYELLYNSSEKYILIAEYYNPTPTTIEYRGHKNKLFKRDFAGEMLNCYKDLKLINYGFCYHLDPHFPQDDITWFLLRK